MRVARGEPGGLRRPAVMVAEALRLDEDPPDLLVLDLMYVPRETKLMRDAKAAGAAEVMNGDTMLLRQTAVTP